MKFQSCSSSTHKTKLEQVSLKTSWMNTVTFLFECSLPTYNKYKLSWDVNSYFHEAWFDLWSPSLLAPCYASHKHSNFLPLLQQHEKKRAHCCWFHLIFPYSNNNNNNEVVANTRQFTNGQSMYYLCQLVNLLGETGCLPNQL